MSLDPVLGDELPLFIFAFPIILAAWFGGLGPGLLATALSLLVGDYLFISPRGTLFHYKDLLTLNRVSFLWFFGFVITVMIERLRESIQDEMASLERSRLLIEGVKDYAIFLLDAQGGLASWNSGAERITGYSANEILGRDISIFFTPEDIEAGNPWRALEIATREGRYEEEGWRVRKDGSRYWASVITTALWDEAGRLRGFAKVTRDNTQRKEIEEERERLLLQEKMAREEAEIASRIKDEFLATISHELRTPLTSILGWARLIADGSIPEQQARRAMDVIAKNAQAQSDIIDNILDTSRIITGSLHLDAQPVDIERIFQASIDVVRPSAEMKGVALTATIDTRGETVFGDANRLQQAIWNLLSNAIKFSNEGGRVDARLARVGNQIEISVSDTGIGIEPQFLAQVFERFWQADSARTRKHGGLGLGLATTRHIIEMHGGEISASSPGKERGATFRIRLPLGSTDSGLPGLPRDIRPSAPEMPAILDAARANGRNSSEESQRLDGLRVLLVEDNSDTMEMLRFIFDERGAEVITAASAPEALDALESRRPDALVSDIALPDQDGYELIQQVRQRDPEVGGAIPAIAVTACASSEDRMRALTSGFQMYVTKPINPNELIAMVASLTGHIQY